MEAQVPDRARFVIPTGDQAPAHIQQAPVVQPVQPAQKFNPQPIQQAPLQTATTVTVDQPQPVPVQNPVQQPMPVQPQQATMGTQFTGPAPENVPF
jgi:hypothetical protein